MKTSTKNHGNTGMARVPEGRKTWIKVAHNPAPTKSAPHGALLGRASNVPGRVKCPASSSTPQEADFLRLAQVMARRYGLRLTAGEAPEALADGFKFYTRSA